MYARHPAIRILVGFVFLIMLAPIFVVMAVSFSPSAAFRVPLSEASLQWYEKFFTNENFTTSLFFVSLPLAIVSSVAASTIGTLAAIGLVRLRLVARDAIESFFMLPLLIPSILLGAAMYLTASLLGFGTTFWVLALGHTLLGIPYAIRVVGAGLVSVDARLEEAAISLGCTPVQAFIRAVLPLLRSSILSGAIFAFIVSFSDINLALFLAGPGTTTLPVHIYSQIFWDSDPTIAAASTMQIVIVGGLILTAQRLFKIRLSF